MKKNNHQLAGKSSRIPRIVIISTLILFLQAFGSSAIAQPGQLENPRVRSYQTYIKSDTAARWSDWNILFHAGATTSQINTLLSDLKTYIDKYIDSCNLANPGLPPLKVDT